MTKCQCVAPVHVAHIDKSNTSTCPSAPVSFVMESSRPWTVIGPLKGNHCRVDDPTALSQELAERVPHKIFAVTVHKSSTSDTSHACYGQAGILRQCEMTTDRASNSQKAFVGRLVTASRLLISRRGNVTAVVIPPGTTGTTGTATPRYAFPGVPLYHPPHATNSANATKSAPATKAIALKIRRRPSRKHVCGHGGIAYSDIQVFNETTRPTGPHVTTFRPFLPVRSDFRYAIGQRVGMAMVHMDAAHATLRSVEPKTTGPHLPAPTPTPLLPSGVYICTGTITYVDESYIEYDIPTAHLAALGSIVFLLDQRQPRTTVQRHDHGRAVAIHTGHAWHRPNVGCGLKLPLK